MPSFSVAQNPLRPQPRILVVEDDPDIAEGIVGHLRSQGYEATHATDGQAGLMALRAGLADLAIADRMLPHLDGLAMIETLRGEGVLIPILILSALGAVDDRVRGLRAGGDDYLTKPFAMDELMARVEALLRRPVDHRQTVLQVGDLRMDLIDRLVERNQRQIDLLPREFKLLEYMMRRPGQTITRAMFLEDVWHYRFTPQTNLVDVHMGKLRHKVDGPNEQQMIVGVPGTGFMLRAAI
jgi:two-component system OmpR family response regulator